MKRLSISLLGSMQVRLDDQEVTAFRSVKNRALLAYLSVEAHHTHDRSVLAGMFWPDHPETAARLNLRQALFALRKLLNVEGTEYIQVDSGTVRFNARADVWIDVVALTDLLAVCERHPHADRADCPICAMHLAEAVALYRGDFLGEVFVGDSFAVEEWILLKREWLRHQVLDALDDLTTFYLRQAAYDQAYRYAWRQIELDPLNENAHRQVMLAQALAGHRSAALSQYEHCRQVLAQDLGVEPAIETVLLAESIRTGDLKPSGMTGETRGSTDFSSPIRHNLPVVQTPLIGRQLELDHLRQWLLAPDERLIVLVGEGGVGKSRLAHAAARKVVQHFRDGVWFVPLVGVGTDARVVETDTLRELLATTIAGSIGLTLHGKTDPCTQLLNYLSGREILIWLDNFEHLLPATELLWAIVQSAPRVTILVTSRERLHFQSERILQLTGLPVPAADALDSDTFDSVKLFVARACRVWPAFTLNEANLAAIVQICRLLEGLPLGIELAASWVEQFTPMEIAAAIATNVDMLATTFQDFPERHRSVRATFIYSWRLLSPGEQTTLAQLAVFQGTWSREAALRVTQASLADLIALVHKSLVQVVAPGRYTLHTLVRHLAAEQVAAIPAIERVARDRHCSYYSELLAAHETHLRGDHQSTALTTLDAERPNIQVAWEWAIQTARRDDLAQAARSLHLFYKYRNHFQEGKELFARVLDSSHLWPDTSAWQNLRGRLLVCLGDFALHLGQYAEAACLLEQSLRLLHDVPDGTRETALDIAHAMAYLGLVKERQGDYTAAKTMCQASLDRYRLLNDRSGMTTALRSIASVAEGLAQYAEAEGLLHESLALSQEIGNRRESALTLNLLGIVTEMQQRYTEACHYYRQSLQLFSEIGERWGMHLPLGNLGDVAFTLGNYQDAKSYYCAALKLLLTSWAVPYMLIQIYRVAAVLAAEDRAEQAVELLQLPLHHPALDQAFRERAEALNASLTAMLPPDRLAAAKVRGRGRTLVQVVNAIADLMPSFAHQETY
ncbi:MAG: BTAD domain-containing putative transcriptional regulator [Chloroflexus sp.]|uniref:AfsR/SARP family transcriptional regulator n=1 Tax=Chloroflexus sp. TaxID=1904827 RepID=UPI0030A7AD09